MALREEGHSWYDSNFSSGLSKIPWVFVGGVTSFVDQGWFGGSVTLSFASGFWEEEG